MGAEGRQTTNGEAITNGQNVEIKAGDRRGEWQEAEKHCAMKRTGVWWWWWWGCIFTAVVATLV